MKATSNSNPNQNILRSTFQPTTSYNFNNYNFSSVNSNYPPNESNKLNQSPDIQITSPRAKNFTNNIKQLENKY